ncbi:branched-chain amino acid ABC transporter ATP-binding protein [Pollutimonas nitritireducens]|uniref:Branched-chain amino acid ABC transporter ATP-binding protein n=1 Tax=Pollutimonas nitritireducens TaxID=2045209 RepID=A0A2N4UG06_9BURK|nr:ABC transporter ATP-binding protein [Pollutimonas nitritireducens]PLC53957.1 branched-chain amino acid ABC transporter ATP-binding protein [Pollutimonas nitritireducens]
MPSLLEVNGLHAGYGLFSVLHGLAFDVKEREIVALVGSNGAGKTTTMRAISGLIQSTGGSIHFNGEETTNLTPSQMVARGLVCVPEGRQLFPEMTVRDTLLVGVSTPRARDRRDQSLKTVYKLFPKLNERSGQLCGTLSGGEQQMVAIGRGLMSAPQLLLLDEPSLGLAPTIVKQLFQAITDIRDQGVTVLIVEQNVRSVLSFVDRAYVIENGSVELSGSAEELINNPDVVNAYFGIGSKESVS